MATPATPVAALPSPPPYLCALRAFLITADIVALIIKLVCLVIPKQADLLGHFLTLHYIFAITNSLKGGWRILIPIESIVFVCIALVGLYLQHYQLVGIFAAMSIVNGVYAFLHKQFIVGLLIMVFAAGMFANMFILFQQIRAAEDAQEPGADNTEQSSAQNSTTSSGATTLKTSRPKSLATIQKTQQVDGKPAEDKSTNK